MAALAPSVLAVRAAARAVTPMATSSRLLTPMAALAARPSSMSTLASQLQTGDPALRLSEKMTTRLTRNVLENIDLMVCDMAGTTVQEGGIVYKTLQLSMKEYGFDVSDEQMEPWHGAKKESVIEHFARQAGTPENQLEATVEKIGEAFVKAIDAAYFDSASTIAHIDVGLFGYFTQLRKCGIKVALNTGYPQDIQQGLIKKLEFEKVIDSYISSYEVPEGRPYPFMINRLVERLGISSNRRVCKVGDSVRDIEEGRNAGCGLVVGVLSGADTAEALLDAGADLVAGCVTDLPVPRHRARVAKLRLPDLS